MNSYLIVDTKPILIDTGLAHDRGPLLNALAGEVDTVLRHLHIVPDRPAWLPDADPVPAARAPRPAVGVMTHSRHGPATTDEIGASIRSRPNDSQTNELGPQP